MSSGLVPPTLEWDSNRQKQLWKLFKQQFELYLLASGAAGKPDKDKVAILLTTGGVELLQIFNSFELDLSDKDTTLKAVLAKLDEYFQPQTNEVLQRYIFQSCRQDQGESGEAYMARLLVLSKSCNFEGAKDKCLRDQFVFGCREDGLREKLFNVKTLSLSRLKEIVRSFDCLADNMMTFRRTGDTREAVHKVHTQNSSVRGLTRKKQSPMGARQSSAGFAAEHMRGPRRTAQLLGRSVIIVGG